jgi:hypothetical protein
MLKMAKTEEEVKLKDDPRTIKDPARWNRLKVMVYEKAVSPAWGCPLYILNTIGWLSNEQREAGDRYQQITLDYNQAQASDPDELPVEARELAYKRVARRKDKWKACIEVLGLGRKVVDALVLHEEHICTESERVNARDGLQLLANLFRTGSKNKR